MTLAAPSHFELWASLFIPPHPRVPQNCPRAARGQSTTGLNPEN